MDQAVLLLAVTGLSLGILWLGGVPGSPLRRLLLRPALLGLFGLVLLVLTPGFRFRWPCGVAAALSLAALAEAYGGVYHLIRTASLRAGLGRQMRLCLIWLVAALLNLVLLNLSASLAYPGTFRTVHGAASALDVVYLTLLTFTSVGYGDVIPGTPLGQVLMMLTSLAGLLYATLLVTALYHTMRED